MIECVKDMENIALSPSTKSKLRNKNNVNRIRHGSPKLQEVLRERCRQKMREKRSQLFNKGRFGLEINCKNVQDTLTDIVRQELNSIATTNLDPAVNPFSSILNDPLNQEEALDIEAEILNEEEQWILQEYEKMSQEETELLALAVEHEIDEVICPTCQTCNLTQEANGIICKSCHFVLSNGMSKKDLGYFLNKCVNTHSAVCQEPPDFLSIPENNNMCLYLVCNKCSTLIPIV